MSESSLYKPISDGLAAIGVWSIRTAVLGKRAKTTASTGEPGMPDLWTELGWMEVKLPGRKLDPDQVAWHQKANKRGVRVGVVHSVVEAVDLALTWLSNDRGHG
jgi:hypothetical protein